jgi:hypothetical protein
LQDVTTWLTASVGVPAQFADAIADLTGTSPRVIVVDRTGTTEWPFFRAPARLLLPDESEQCIGVGVVVVRPDGRSAHLRVAGCYQWPQERDAMIRALETMVQAYADQWFPDHALWSGAAEQLLRGEIE